MFRKRFHKSTYLIKLDTILVCEHPYLASRSFMQTQQIRNSVLEWLGRNANKVNGHPTPCFHQWVDALQLNPFDDPYNTWK